MGKVRRYKNIIEKFLASEKGQRFFNFCFSIGAAVVILGALLKILHADGGDLLLCIGMGTEVLMFVLTAFDRPETEYHWEEVFPVLKTRNEEDRPDFAAGSGIIINGGANVSGSAEDNEDAPTPVDSQATTTIVGGGNVATGGTTIIGGGVIGGGAVASAPITMPADINEAAQLYFEQMTAITEQMQKLKETTEALNNVSEVLLNSYSAITQNSEDISKSSTGYVEQMANLNKNIGGLNTIYEIQLRSVSSQLDNIDRVNRGLKDIRDMYEKTAAESASYCDETEKLAHNMKQLNSVYEKMVKAMTVSMYRPGAAGNINDNE